MQGSHQVDSHRPWLAQRTQPSSHGHCSPYMAPAQFQHASASTWNQESMLAVQQLDRPSSANSAISNVRGALSEPLSSPVALRSAAVTICEVLDSQAVEWEDATYNSGLLRSHSPIQIPTSLNIKPSYHRADSFPGSDGAIHSINRSQWTAYRGGSFASTLSPATSDFATSLDTPPLLYPRHHSQYSGARYSYTSEDSDSRRPSYSSVGSFDENAPCRSHQHALSAPTGGLGLIMNDSSCTSAFQGMRAREISYGGSDSVSSGHEDFFTLGGSQAHFPTASLSFSDTPESVQPRKRAYEAGEYLTYAHHPQVRHAPTIVAPRPGYAAGSGPAFLSAQFHTSLHNQESRPPSRHSLYSAHYERSSQDYEEHQSPIQWQQSFSSQSDGISQIQGEQAPSQPEPYLATHDGVSPLSYPEHSNRSNHTIPLPQTGYFDQPSSAPVPIPNASARVLSPLPRRASLPYSGFTDGSTAFAHTQALSHPAASCSVQQFPSHFHSRKSSGDCGPSEYKRSRQSQGSREIRSPHSVLGDVAQIPATIQNWHPIVQPASQPTRPSTMSDFAAHVQPAPVPIEGTRQPQLYAVGPAASAFSATETIEATLSDDDVSGDFTPNAPALAATQVQRRTSARKSSSCSVSAITYRPGSPQALPPTPLLQLPASSLNQNAPAWQTRRPPPADFAVTDPDLLPKQQKTRFADDMYTPKWTRGKGQTKEGWCAICPQGKWLQLKTSAFWYHKQYTHGISSTSGYNFLPPIETRESKSDGGIEGFCHGCSKWQKYQSKKQRGTSRGPALFWKHAHKCHSYFAPPKNDEESDN